MLVAILSRNVADPDFNIRLSLRLMCAKDKTSTITKQPSQLDGNDVTKKVKIAYF